MKIEINNFCKRQTEASHFSHFDGDESVLLELLEANFEQATPSKNTEGAVIVPLPPQGFWTPIVPITGTDKLDLKFEPRREGEDPYLEPIGIGEKSPARSVRAVLYSHETLGPEASTDAEWELISFNAEPGEEESPMHPITMARNTLGLEGGTKATYSSEEWATSTVFWSRHVQVAPRDG